MSGAEDEAVLADILHTAGQRAEEIRVEIASLKEKTGNNAITVPQLLKGDAFPDVREPAEATRQDEPDTSQQFTVSTPSGERQAPPKTEDGTDTEDLEQLHAALHSPTQAFARPSNKLAAGRQPDAAGWPNSTADTGSSDGSCLAAGAQASPGSWQGLYQGMLGKLNKSQATEQQCASSVVALLKSAGMASAADSSSCNARLHHLATPFAQHTSQAAAVAAGAIPTQQQQEHAEGSGSLAPSPVHVVGGPYRMCTGAAAAADATPGMAEDAQQWGPACGAQSPSKAGRAEPGSDAGGSGSAHDADGITTPQRLVVPASAADLPVQAVLDELDELLSRSSRTPTHQQQQQQQQQAGQGRLFSRSDNAGNTEEDMQQRQRQQNQGLGSVVGDALAAGAAAGGGGGGAVADEDEDWVLRWLRSQKGHMSRCNSTSCLLSDEFLQRTDRSSSSCDNSSRMRRSCSLPPEPFPRASASAGGMEAAAAAAGAERDEGGAKPLKQLQQQHDCDIKDEILAHLRLAAAFRPQARDRPSNSSLPQACTPPAAALGAASATAAALAPLAAWSPEAAGAARDMAHGVSLVDWVGQRIEVPPTSAVPAGSSCGEGASIEAQQQLLCRRTVQAAESGVGHALTDGDEHGSCSKLTDSSFSVNVAAAPAAAAAAAAGVLGDQAAGNSLRQGQAPNAAAGAAAVLSSPKSMSKSAQLYQQLLMRSPGLLLKGSSGGSSSSSGRSRDGSGRGGAGSSHLLQGSRVQQGVHCRSPCKASSSDSAGGVAQQVSPSMAEGGWPSSDAAVQCTASPGKQWLELQLPESQTEQEAAGSSVTCTACGSPVLAGRPGTTLQHTRTSIADLTAEIAASAVAKGEAAAAAAAAPAAGTHAVGAAVDSEGRSYLAPNTDDNVVAAAPASAAAAAGGGAQGSPNVRGHTTAASASDSNSTYTASFASISLAELMGGAAGSSSSSNIAGGAGCCSLRLHSTAAAAAAGSPSRMGSHTVYSAEGSAPATPKGSSHRKQRQPAGYAALGRPSVAARLAGRHSSQAAATRTSCSATGRPSGYAGTAAERVGRPRVGTASMPGTAAATSPAKAVKVEEVPAVATAISCGQLLAAAALEQALGRVSAGGAAAAEPGPGSAALTADQDEQMLEQELGVSGAKGAEPTQQVKAGESDRPNSTGLLELERDMEEAALEDELAALQVSGSTAGAVGQKHQTSASLFVYRLQPTNEPAAGTCGGDAAPSGGAGGSTTAAAAAAAAALQTLAACASRKVPRCASLSPSRMSSSASLSRMGSMKQMSAGASNRSSSTDMLSRASAGMSRSSSAKSSAAPGFGSSSSRDGSSSAGGSRVWRPGGRRTSAKDDCRKLQDYESARSRILGPVTEAGAAGGVGDASDRKGSSDSSPKPSAFGRSSSPAKKPGRAGAAAVAAAAAAAAAAALGGGTTGAGAKARGTAGLVGSPRARAGVAAMTSAAAAPTSKSAMAAARAAARSTPPRSPVPASRAAAAARGNAAATGTTCDRTLSGATSVTTAAVAEAATDTPLKQEQGVQADIQTPRTAVGPLPRVPQLLDPSSLLHELSLKSQRPVRHSTPGRLQAASRFPASGLPGQQQQHQHGSASPTTTQVEEAIKAAQVALLQRRWQILQLRKTMAQHGIASTAGNRSSRSSSSANHGSLLSSTMRHGSRGLEAGSGGSSLEHSMSNSFGSAGDSIHGSAGQRVDSFGDDGLEAAGSCMSQPLAAAAEVPGQLLQGFSRDKRQGDTAAAADGAIEEGAAVASSPVPPAAAVEIRHHSSTSGAAETHGNGAAAAGPNMHGKEQHGSVASRSPSPRRPAAAAAAAAAEAVPAAAKYRSASAFDAGARLSSEEPHMPLRPSSAQAVVMKAPAAAAAVATVAEQKHYTATIFASPRAQQQGAAAAPHESAARAQSGIELGSRRSSCCKDLNPLRRRSSLGSTAAEGSSAGSSGGSPAAALPPWSAARRVSSCGLTGEELMSYYRRSSVAAAAEAAAEAAAAGEAPAAGLQLDVLLRAFNALAKRRNTADKSSALAALMGQIMAVADGASAAMQGAATADAAGEPLVGMDARELTVDSESSALLLEISKLDVLGRSVSSSPRPAPLLCDTTSGRGSPGIAGGSVLQVLKGDMRAGWQSACAERQAAHDSLLSTPRHKRPASAGYAADLAALTSGCSMQGASWLAGQPQQLAGPDEREEDCEAAARDGCLSPTHAVLAHTAARLGGSAEGAGGSHGGSELGTCTGIPLEALAAAAPYGNGIVVVRMSTTDTSGRLPLLRDTPAGKAVLAGIDGTSLTVQQAVHWLKVGLTRLPSANEGGRQRQSPSPGSKAAKQAPRPASPHLASRRARSRPCSPFRACFSSQSARWSEEDEEEAHAVQQQQQEEQQQEGVHFEMDSASQLVMVVPQSLAAHPQGGADRKQQQQQQQQFDGGAASVHRYTVTGVALPADEGCQPGVSGSGCHCLELVTSAGRHRIELASERDFAGLLAGLNAMLLLKEAGGDAAEKLGVLPLEETAWAAAVEGWQGPASAHCVAGHSRAV